VLKKSFLGCVIFLNRAVLYPNFLNYRFGRCLSHRIVFYRRNEQTIWIVAVWHSAQLPAVPQSSMVF